MNLRSLFLLAIVVSASCTQVPEHPTLTPDKVTQWVDPFIGTGDHGHTYPGATVPFGMVQLSPDNGTQGWDWCSGYNYADSVIVGFSHTHLSGTGIGDLADISMMPFVGDINPMPRPDDHKKKSYAASFSHANEVASPGFYSVVLDNGIKTELTASRRSGFHRYTFNQKGTHGIILDLNFAINWDRTTASTLQMESDRVLSGYRYSTGWAKDQRIHFVIEFSTPIKSLQTWVDGMLKENSSLQGSDILASLVFDSEQVLAKVGISSASIDGARKALEEIPDWDFEKTRKQADTSWHEALSKVLVTTDDEELKKTFYTSLYHTMVAPVLYEDSNGEYKGADSVNHTSDGYTRYDIFSLWDTFRAENPLLTLLHPDKVDDIVQSLLAHYQEYGLLPVWSLLGNETNTMTGYHSIPVIADAYLKGFEKFDIDLAYEAMKKSAMQDIRGTKHYREYGYIPYDKDGQSVTKTLEYAYDDWCIAQVALKLGKKEEYEVFMSRAANYLNLFDPSTHFMRAKLSDGTWKTPFDPKYSSHDFSVAEYTEGNAWQHSWFVPHDIAGLIDLHGGSQPFVGMLDSLFNEDSEITGDYVSSDISGLIGQYAHGNEPSHHIAYMYSYAGQPWKTQKQVDDIVHSMYNSKPTGLCGNEDCGQMSAWYVFSSLGFYPVNPAEGIYVFGSPQFDEAVISFGSKEFIVRAGNASKDAPYIQSARLNGEVLDRTYSSHEEITNGGVLEFTMGTEPNRAWGSSNSSRPPSMSDKN